MGTTPIVPFVDEALLADLDAQVKEELQGAEEVTPELVSMVKQKFGIIPPQPTTTWIKR